MTSPRDRAGGGDLPSGIGRPATRALEQAGITTLAAVSRHSAKELLALHGLGPKAIRVLTESLGERGLGFRVEDFQGTTP
ncbi:hypothetical protein ERC79_02835 [Rhodococcus sp. ABRD24]|uniref:hypothetical protein n=1 Tax=Rhodococcus sp. ABRD24 TaxID=2507582 RepID=UPI00103F2AE9|nr:hypothetical protein [Rhodococcus sp. ABRD24]QBJ95016.1 hypothetical protein ERC79_02835 [Rhodococcus sp. ABRD24]